MERSTVLNGAPEAVTAGVVASDNSIIFPDDLAQTLNYNGDGTLNYIEVTVPATVTPQGTTVPGGTYRQTYGYTTGRVTSISRWTKQ